MITQKTILIFQIASTIFALILGTLLHFTFNWSSKNVLVGAISAVNESTWEHLKLAFFPMLITLIVGNLYFGSEVPNFLCAKTIGIIVAISFITIFFYTYTGILGTNYAIVNILSFFFAVILGEYVAYKITLSDFNCNPQISMIVLLILFFSFIIFTYFPPKIGLFKCPLTNTYGIFKN